MLFVQGTRSWAMQDNVATAKASFCRTTTGSNSFDPNCDANSGEFPSDIKTSTQVASCLHNDSVNASFLPHVDYRLSARIRTGGLMRLRLMPVAMRGNHRTGTATARATLCVNGTEHENCPTIGPSFTAWADGDAADTGADILDAGAGTTTVNANFIKGVLNADGIIIFG